MKGRHGLEGYGGMDQVMKMDCRANGEVIWGVRKPHQPHFCEMSSPLIEMDRNKKMACAVEPLSQRTTEIEGNPCNRQLLRKERSC